MHYYAEQLDLNGILFVCPCLCVLMVLCLRSLLPIIFFQKTWQHQNVYSSYVVLSEKALDKGKERMMMLYGKGKKAHLSPANKSPSDLMTHHILFWVVVAPVFKGFFYCQIKLFLSAVFPIIHPTNQKWLINSCAFNLQLSSSNKKDTNVNLSGNPNKTP